MQTSSWLLWYMIELITMLGGAEGGGARDEKGCAAGPK